MMASLRAAHGNDVSPRIMTGEVRARRQVMCYQIAGGFLHNVSPKLKTGDGGLKAE